jgi:hypothetical protein
MRIICSSGTTFEQDQCNERMRHDLVPTNNDTAGQRDMLFFNSTPTGYHDPGIYQTVPTHIYMFVMYSLRTTWRIGSNQIKCSVVD